MSKTKVLVVDDSMTMRALLCGALERVKDVEVVGLANGAAEAREMVKTHRPHVMTLSGEKRSLFSTSWIPKYFWSPHRKK